MSHSSMGKYYFGIRIVRDKKPRLLNVLADRIEVRGGDLLLWGHNSEDEPGSFLYRAFARGTWLDVYSASCLDGSEMSEDHDIDLKTGKDARI